MDNELMAGDCADNPSRQQTDGGEPTNRYLDAIDAMPTQDPSALRPVLLLLLQMPHEAEAEATSGCCGLP